MNSADETRAEYAGLQKELAGHCETIKDLEPESLDFQRVYDQLTRNAQQLLTLDKDLPARLAEPGRRRSARFIRWSLWGQIALGAVFGVLAATSLTTWPASWLLLLVPHMLASTVGFEVTVSADHHVQLLFLTLGLHLVGAFLVLSVAGLLPVVWAVLAAIGWVLIARKVHALGVL